MIEDRAFEATLAVAEDVVTTLHERHIDAVVIGAMALAVHGYPRGTVDFDLAVAVEPKELHAIACALAARGYAVAVRDPDPTDPLGGVVDVRAAAADLVQVVNFANPPGGGFPRLVTEALAAAEPLIEGRPLRVADLYHLIAFKLYAGGPKSTLDILELLERNPELDLARLRALCAGYRLSRQLNAILRQTRR